MMDNQLNTFGHTNGGRRWTALISLLLLVGSDAAGEGDRSSSTAASTGAQRV